MVKTEEPPVFDPTLPEPDEPSELDTWAEILGDRNVAARFLAVRDAEGDHDIDAMLDLAQDIAKIEQKRYRSWLGVIRSVASKIKDARDGHVKARSASATLAGAIERRASGAS